MHKIKKKLSHNYKIILINLNKTTIKIIQIFKVRIYKSPNFLIMHILDLISK
jgi:hypothetical protein